MRSLRRSPRIAALSLALFIPALFVPAPLAAGPAPPSSIPAFLRDIAGQAARAKNGVVRGRGGWLFYAPELHSQSAGRFWGPGAARVNRRMDPHYADPLPVIVDLHRQLAAHGIELLYLPLPAKAAVYPELISRAVSVPPGKTPPRLDVTDQAFFAALRAQGVSVLDPLPLFLANRYEGGLPVFYRQETHCSSRGYALAAQAVAARLKGRAWLAAVPKHLYATQAGVEASPGDLGGMLDGPSAPREPQPMTYVQERTVTGIWPFRRQALVPVPEDDASPIVLVGDSNCTAFSRLGEGRGAGLADHLALQLGFPVETVSVAGSGGQAALKALRRRSPRLAGKKLVIWCFTVRELTEGAGWKKIPLFPP